MSSLHNAQDRRRFVIGLVGGTVALTAAALASACSSPFGPDEEREGGDDEFWWTDVDPNDASGGGLLSKPANASGSGYRIRVTRLFAFLVEPDRIVGALPSAWDMLRLRNLRPVAEETTLGYQLQSIAGQWGQWCCAIGRTWPGSSGRSVVSRVGVYDTPTNEAFDQHVRRFRYGTLGLALDPGDGTTVQRGDFDLFGSVPDPGDGKPFYVCWFLSASFNRDGARTLT